MAATAGSNEPKETAVTGEPEESGATEETEEASEPEEDPMPLHLAVSRLLLELRRHCHVPVLLEFCRPPLRRGERDRE